MDTYIISKVEKKLNQIRFQSKLELKKETDTFYKLHPDIFGLENQKRLIVSDPSLSKDEKRTAVNTIDKRINEIIDKNNLAFPHQKFKCNVCNDSGYVEKDGKKERCSCFTRMLIDEAMKNENCSNIISFDDFNESIFDDKIKKEILNIRNHLKTYSEKFPNVKKPNTILFGNTGTGKTFLLSCVYTELKKKGISVVFLTAGRLFDMLKKYAFNQINDIDVLLDAEMLIIDDLGTEPMFNNITIEYLFMLINERSRNNKSMLISTNFSADDLKNHYTERISSRLLDKSATNKIFIPGNDLRLRF